METKELSQQESDALILKELGLTEDDSIINDTEEEETSEEETEEASEVETEEEEDSETDEEQEEEVEPKASKKQNGFKKVLSQRNAARKEADEAKSQVQKLQEKLEKLSEDGEYGNEEYVQTLVEKRLAEADEINEYFDENEELKSYRKDIISYSKELGIGIDRATKLYLAENNPSLLLDKNEISKTKSKMFNPSMQTSKKLTKGTLTYSDKEFDAMAAKGLIKF